MTLPSPPHHTFHLEFPRKKHEENSRRGIAEAVAGGFTWIDLDNRHDGAGISWNTHWDMALLRDGFRNPHHRTSRFARISKMPSGHVAELATTDGYVIRRSVNQVIAALVAGLKVEFEVKDNTYDAAFFQQLHAVIDDNQLDPTHVWVKGYPRFHRSVRAAHGIFTTVLLTHGAKVPAAYQAFSDYHRGPVTWTA